MKNVLKLMGLSGAIIAPMAFSPMTMAAGFQLNEFSVASMGRAHAGEPAMSDNAGVIARNPAASGMFEKRNYSIVLHYIEPDVNVEGTVSHSSAVEAQIDAASPPTATAYVNAVDSVDASADDVAPSAVVPGFYYVSPIDDKWAWGIAINSHFGMSTEYGADFAGSEFADETMIKTYYVTPSFSFKPIEELSLGFGVSYIYGEGEIKNNVSPTLSQSTGFLSLLPSPPFPVVPALTAGTPLLSVDGDGDAFGWQLGLLWEINDQVRLGARYESAVDLEFEGDIVYLPGTGDTAERSGTLTIDLPDVFELGVVYDIDDSWSVMLGAQMTGWSSFEELSGGIDGFGDQLLKDEQWDDAWRYSIGAETQLNETTTLRFGYALDESPVDDEHRTLTIPDADRNWYTFGATFDLHDSNIIDMSLVYIDGDSVEVHEATSASEFNGELSATNVYIVSMGYNYSF